MCGVLNDDELMFVCKLDHLSIKIVCCHLSGWTIGVVDHNHLGPPPRLVVDLTKVRIEMVFGQEWQSIHRATVVFCMSASNGIAGHSHHRDVTRVDEARGQHGQSGLAANAMIDLGCRIQFDLKLAFHESTDGLLKFSGTVVHVPAIFRSIDLDGHLLPDFAVCHRVVFTDAIIEQSAIRVVSHGFAFSPLDLFELVDLIAFAVANTADSLGEKLLEIGVLYRGRWFS